MAKSRALYGKRLKKQDYDSLVNCKNINELVTYLKTRTAYAETFETANSEMSAFQVEELLKVDTLKVFQKISKYEISTGEHFYKYFIMKNDISEILKFLHYLIVGRAEEYLKILPPFINEQTDVDLISLSSAQNFDDVLKVLKGTPYDDALKPFRATYKQPETYIEMETALNKILWDAEYSIVERYKGKQKKEITELLTYETDMENIVRIYRLKRLASADKDTIKEYLNPHFTHFTHRDVEKMLEKSTAREMLQQAADSYYKKYFASTQFLTLEDFTQRIIYQKLHKEIRYSTDPVAVMICYFFLKQNEVDNVIHIAEGIRGKIPAETIESVLIGTDN
ncbi:MAG: V-type ATPase subunit [Clostridia bacterium]|nr:V-type ATPase subunit [Clostridia bacterium]